MTAAPALSIVMPVLNEAASIVAGLQALQSWRASGVEIIVVDGGSGDASAELAAPLADQILAAPRGRARQMNAGGTAARGRVLLFLHADTRLPDASPSLVAAALAAGAVWGRFDVAIAGRSPWLKLVAGMMNWRSRLTGIATGDQAIFVSREVFQMLGGFADIPLMEDIELSRRLKEHSPPACLSERATTSGRRWETNGVWRTIALMWRLRFDYWRGIPAERLALRYRPHSKVQERAE